MITNAQKLEYLNRSQRAVGECLSILSEVFSDDSFAIDELSNGYLELTNVFANLRAELE